MRDRGMLRGRQKIKRQYSEKEKVDRDTKKKKAIGDKGGHWTKKKDERLGTQRKRNEIHRERKKR